MRFLDWSPFRHRPTTKRQTIFQVLQGSAWLFAVIGVFALLYSSQPYRLTFNNSWSMPYGLWAYKQSDSPVYEIGQPVVTKYTAPNWIARRAWSEKIQRRLVKDVRGVPGDHLQVHDGVISNCGMGPALHCHVVATRVAWDSHKDPLYFVRLPSVIPPDHYLLIGENPMSLDSRYLGLFSGSSILGPAYQLYTWPIGEKAKQAIGYQIPVPELPVPANYWSQESTKFPLIPLDTRADTHDDAPGWSYYNDEGQSETVPFISQTTRPLEHP